ncbi:hypothetical protein PCANC_16401 [Puccinia coronata f. sp. avenae]|uniref:Uncharacterized protein n=2 Tax=Puccinia coronata f. sp. avenae TaxID=200324 RepID=A0A2N5SAS3_9BASI|nr:hypothetical protein PCASD_22803 [Puccinia coronata f. sp. avenae]PLW18283.1 hypothetical protein PCANC_16401 [Puccinia coronata f. sp. avenae]
MEHSPEPKTRERWTNIKRPLNYEITKIFPRKLRMVSLCYLISLLSVLVAVSRAEDITASKGEGVDAKFWYGGGYGGWRTWGGASLAYWYNPSMYNYNNPWIYSNNYWSNYFGNCYGAAFFSPGYSYRYFAKAADSETHSVSRRAIRLDGDLLSRRNSAGAANCLSAKGESQVFLKDECTKAAELLREKNGASASSGSCKLTLVSTQGHVVAKDIPEHGLQKAVKDILANCGQSAQQAKDVDAVKHVDEKQVALILSRA